MNTNKMARVNEVVQHQQHVVCLMTRLIKLRQACIQGEHFEIEDEVLIRDKKLAIKSLSKMVASQWSSKAYGLKDYEKVFICTIENGLQDPAEALLANADLEIHLRYDFTLKHLPYLRSQYAREQYAWWHWQSQKAIEICVAVWINYAGSQSDYPNSSMFTNATD